MLLLTAIGGIAMVQSAGTEVTIYNQGFALVKEVRQFDLAAGRGKVAVDNVAALIEPNSVGFRTLSSNGTISVLEQNYQYDLISVEAILNKAVGKRITFNRVLPNGHREQVSGTLLSAPSAIVRPGTEGYAQATYNGMVVRTDDGRILLNPTGEVEVAEIPEGLISKPTLLWDLIAERAGTHTVELSYLTQGMNWTCDYVLTLADDLAAGLVGWVTLDNRSGRTYEDARLKLLAGDVHRATPRIPGRGGAPEMMHMRADAEMGFQQESLFEYHLYTLQRPTTIRDRETKQVNLLDAEGLQVTKRLVVDSMRQFGRWAPNEGEVGTGRINPLVQIEFENTAENRLGMPLPEGTVKVYQRDRSGSVQMLGEDRIQHTPRNERIRLAIGRSFDVVAERKRTMFQRLAPNITRETFQIEVRNRKEVAETVHVIERAWGDWQVSRNNMDFERLDANAFQFVVTLGPNETKVVEYTIETRF